MNPLQATVPCPKCREKISIPLEAMAPGRSHPCPSCGTVMKFSGQDASKLRQTLEQLGGALPGASIKVNIKTRTRRPWWKFWGG